jgi:hypothetical protein
VRYLHCERCDAESYGASLCSTCEVTEDRDRLAARVKDLEEALRKHCTGTVSVDCSMCADPTWDHECDDRVEPCRTCAALAAKEEAQSHPDDCACFYCCEE